MLRAVAETVARLRTELTATMNYHNKKEDSGSTQHSDKSLHSNSNNTNENDLP